MKKTTKGALAAAAAGTLLLGGAGSLAFWTASQTATGGSFTTGTLTLAASGPCSGWTYATTSNGNTAGGAVNLVVPGDVITKTCGFTVGATGDNLSATLAAPANVTLAAPAGTTSWSATANTTFTLAGSPIANGATVTSTDNGDALVATFTVTFPHGTDGTGTPIVNWNDTQSKTATLGDLTVSLTQN